MVRHSWRDVLLVSLLYLSPSIVMVLLSVSVPGTLVFLGALLAALVRRAPTERWFGAARRSRGARR